MKKNIEKAKSSYEDKLEDPTDNKTRDTGKITTLEKSHVMDIEDDNEDTIESVY